MPIIRGHKDSGQYTISYVDEGINWVIDTWESYDIYPRWPIKVRIVRSWSKPFRKHWIEMGYKRPGQRVLATVIHLGWIRVILGKRKPNIEKLFGDSAPES